MSFAMIRCFVEGSPLAARHGPCRKLDDTLHKMSTKASAISFGQNKLRVLGRYQQGWQKQPASYRSLLIPFDDPPHAIMASSWRVSEWNMAARCAQHKRNNFVQPHITLSSLSLPIQPQLLRHRPGAQINLLGRADAIRPVSRHDLAAAQLILIGLEGH